MEPVFHATPTTEFTLLPWPERPFCALILAPQPIGDAVRSDLSHALVDAGCISMGAWGPDSIRWDDTGDYACILHRDGRLRDSMLDMITWWMDKDALTEALDFARQDASRNTSAPLVLITFDTTLPGPNLGFGAALA